MLLAWCELVDVHKLNMTGVSECGILSLQVSVNQLNSFMQMSFVKWIMTNAYASIVSESHSLLISVDFVHTLVEWTTEILKERQF